MTGIGKDELVSGVLGDGVVQSTVLEDLSTAVRYRHWLASLAAPHLGSRPIEIGSGTGDYAQEWSSGVETFTCSEAEPNRLAALRARFEDRSDIDVVKLVIPIDVEGDHSAVVAYNVLEHIPKDVEALKAMAGLVAPGGKVVVIVPAVPFAMSRFDLEIGHQRRYTRRSLTAALNHAELETEIVHYVNPVGLVAWVVLMKLMRRRPRAGMVLNAYDRFLVPVLMRLESRRHAPLGQSLFAVARKPT